MTVRMQLPNSMELRWWLQGYGSNIEVLKPAKLRAEMREVAKELAETYPSAARKKRAGS